MLRRVDARPSLRRDHARVLQMNLADPDLLGNQLTFDLKAEALGEVDERPFRSSSRPSIEWIAGSL